jgi:heat shock protein HtpX
MIKNYLKTIFLKIRFIVQSDKIILHIYRTHPADAGELSEIREKLNALSNRAGVRPPTLYTTELPLPGSFIIGKNPDDTVLVFPKRLLNFMKPDQIEAVLAYNLVQINDNIGIRTFVAMAASLMTLSASAIRWCAVFTGFGDYNDPAPKLFGTFVMGLAAPPAAAFVQSVAKEEYDTKATALCGDPDMLIQAIENLENNNVAAYPSIGFLCLVDPQKEFLFEHLFNSHPSRETRIKKLSGMRRATPQ